MLKKLKQQTKDAYNKHFGKDHYEEMKDEESNKNQDFSKSPLSLPNQIKSDDYNDKSDQTNQNQNFDKNLSEVPQLDFSKALIPEELIQQQQEQEIQQIAEEQANKKNTKPKQNDEIPDFLNKKICLDENGDNYYEVAAKKAKEENSIDIYSLSLLYFILVENIFQSEWIYVGLNILLNNKLIKKYNFYDKNQSGFIRIEFSPKVSDFCKINYILLMEIIFNGSTISNQATSAQNSVKKQLKKLDTHIKNKILEKKQHINLWIAGQVDQSIVSLMSSIEPKITDSVQKSVPYDFMQDFAQDTAINLWKDFTDVIRLELRAKIETSKVEIKKRDSKGVIQNIRNFILYSLYPADLTNRDHMRRISYQIMKISQLLPYMGIQPLMFSIILLCINKDEEFQLVNFIADYKSIQFITNGLISCFLAYFHYLFFDCGPGSHHQVQVLIFTLIIQVLSVWIAYFFLRKSNSKGAFLREQLTITQDSKGGRLKYFLVYDLISLSISIILSSNDSLINYILIYLQNKRQSYLVIWRFIIIKMNDINYIFYKNCLCITQYSICLFYLSIFCQNAIVIQFKLQIYILNLCITNAIPTGYDKYGNCIPSLSTIQISYKETKLRRQTLIDIEDILERDLLDKNENEDKKQEDQNNDNNKSQIKQENKNQNDQENKNNKKQKQNKEMQKTIG